MRKITTLIIFTTILALSSCGQATTDVIDNNLVELNPSDTPGTMSDSSSTIILDDSSITIEGKAEAEIINTTDGPL